MKNNIDNGAFWSHPVLHEMEHVNFLDEGFLNRDRVSSTFFGMW